MDWIFYVLFLAVAIASGYLISYLSRDELIQGRKWFQWLIIASFVLCISFFVFGFYPEALTFLFILIVSWISYIKSKDKKWTKKI